MVRHFKTPICSDRQMQVRKNMITRFWVITGLRYATYEKDMDLFNRK